MENIMEYITMGNTMEIIIVAIIWVMLVMLVARWAETWDRSALAWTLISLFLSPLIGAFALLLAGRNREAYKRCPACAELIKNEARVCRFCHHDFEGYGEAKKRCPACAEPVRFEAKVCPFCKYDLTLKKAAPGVSK